MNPTVLSYSCGCGFVFDTERLVAVMLPFEIGDYLERGTHGSVVLPPQRATGCELLDALILLFLPFIALPPFPVFNGSE